MFVVAEELLAQVFQYVPMQVSQLDVLELGHVPSEVLTPIVPVLQVTGRSGRDRAAVEIDGHGPFLLFGWLDLFGDIAALQVRHRRP